MRGSMSVLQTIKSLLGLQDDSDELTGLEALQTYLAEKEETLGSLTAVFTEPTVDTQGEVTAVFPYTVFHEGELYGYGTKEFLIPDSGLQGDSALSDFLANHGIFAVDELGQIEGIEVDASLNEETGDITVEV